MLTSAEIRKRFLEFFAKRGHAVLTSAPLVTSEEKGVTDSTLFNTAGMQPLVPYLLGKKHPSGTRLADIQKCIRTVDLADVGDKTHATFFEMMGNWSLGDYFKKEAIGWSYEFLTSTSEVVGDRGLGLNPNRLYVTVFEGDENASRDDDAAQIWKDIFARNDVSGAGANTLNKGEAGRVFYLPASKNWWEAGDNGPCGPDTEMYYDIANTYGGKPITREQFVHADMDDVREVVEVWNDVFMQYEKKDGKIIGKLAKPSVDTGAGLERLTMTLQGADNIYDTDLFHNVMVFTATVATKTQNQRIIADHMRAASFLIAEGVVPSNTDRGYILRRLIRRAVINTDLRQFSDKNISDIIGCIVEMYGVAYPEIRDRYPSIINTLKTEIAKFSSALDSGTKEFEKIAKQVSSSSGSVTRTNTRTISGADAFKLFSSYGLPIDFIIDLAKEFLITVDVKGFDDEFKKHQALSRSGAEQKFKGGLADTSDMTVRYHTATHLLHQALHDIYGDAVMQKGSNINSERLRFDFVHGAKMTDDEKKKVEEIVNKKITEALPMNMTEMPLDEALKTGARHSFDEKYGDKISVYFVGDKIDSAYSKEFCGGPHVKNTSELAGPEGKWKFKILKEEAVSAGVRRIKAVLA